jgi:F-type H+-transporting ATPase subunit b
MSALLFILASEAAGHAAPGAEPHVEHTELIQVNNLLPAITALVVFLVAFGFLYLKVWPKIVGGLDARERKIRDEIAAAESARKAAEAAQAQYQADIAKAQEAAHQMIAKAKADAKAVADELRARNETDLAEMKTRATREIETAKQAAIGSLHAEASNLAVAIAGRILQREISPSDQQNLMDESIRELAKAR